MKNFNISYLLFLLVILASCSKGVKVENSIENKLNFKDIDTVRVHKIDYTLNADSWFLMGDNIICHTDSPDSIYLVIDKDTFQKKYFFGHRGHGKNEWVSPHSLAKDSYELFVFDNGDKKMYSVMDGRIEYLRGTNINDAINDARTINYPIVGYVSATPNVQYLKLVNFENGVLVDSISFVDTSNKGNSSLYDFVWNSYRDKIVIAHQHSDRFIVNTIDNKCNIIETTIHKTNDDFSMDRITYSDISCGKYIYLLSQKKVNVNDVTGFSEIEIYDYDGTCVKKIVTDIIADKLLLDEQNNRLLLTSVEDNSINIVKL